MQQNKKRNNPRKTAEPSRGTPQKKTGPSRGTPQKKTESSRGKSKKVHSPSHSKHRASRTSAPRTHTTLTGVLTVTKGGVGFFTHETLKDDLRIERDFLNTALNGDTVEVIQLPSGSRNERPHGKVVKVLERAQTQFVGTLRYEDNIWKLATDNPRMYATMHVTPHAELREGYKALITLVKWESSESAPEGTLEQMIGKAGEHETEMQAILLDRGFESGFPPLVEQEAKKLQETLRDIPTEELQWREDFRTIPTFTIDPHDAKDFDDALSIRALENGNYEVGVHIADVTHYVHPKTALDTEAQKRATSVYLVDRTIPMLPEGISNDLCSLNPNEDKRAFAAIFELSTEAKVVNARFAKTLINSNVRFTYRTAQDVLEGKEHEYADDVRALWKLSHILRAQRVAAGAIEFESDEIQFELDDQGVPINAFVKEKLDTMKLIEEFMLLANRTVAKHISDNCEGVNPSRSMSLYRIHDAPDPDKLAELSVFLRALGHDHFSKEPHQIKAKDIAKLMHDIQGTPEEAVVQMATLRSMAKAIYSDKNVGHFSLGFSHYTHFTSPIRRYPDMIIHRILFAHLTKTTISEEEIASYRHMAIQSSQREVEAVRAERDSVKFKQVEFMLGRVGKTFTGKITGVSKGGMFVAEDATHAEGMVRMNAIPGDWFELNEKHYEIVGRKTGTKYRIGDTVNIRLKRADIEAKELDWEVVE